MKPNQSPYCAISTAIEMYFLDMEARSLSSKTIETAKLVLDQFDSFLCSQGLSDITEVKPVHIRAYQVSLQKRKLKPNTQHLHSRNLRTFFFFLMRDELIESNPFKKVKMPSLPRPLPKGFTDEEISQILKVAQADHPRSVAIVKMLLSGGFRNFELCELKYKNINMRTGQVFVSCGKMGIDRYTNISADARKSLLLYFRKAGTPKPEEPIFKSLNQKSPYLTPAALRQLFQRFQKQLPHIKNLESGTFRKTFAISLLAQGLDIYSVAALMGHQNITTLKHYLEMPNGDTLTELHGKFSRF